MKEKTETINGFRQMLPKYLIIALNTFSLTVFYEFFSNLINNLHIVHKTVIYSSNHVKCIFSV